MSVFCLHSLFFLLCFYTNAPENVVAVLAVCLPFKSKLSVSTEVLVLSRVFLVYALMLIVLLCVHVRFVTCLCAHSGGGCENPGKQKRLRDLVNNPNWCALSAQQPEVSGHKATYNFLAMARGNDR